MVAPPSGHDECFGYRLRAHRDWFFSLTLLIAFTYVNLGANAIETGAGELVGVGVGLGSGGLLRWLLGSAPKTIG